MTRNTRYNRHSHGSPIDSVDAFCISAAHPANSIEDKLQSMQDTFKHRIAKGDTIDNAVNDLNSIWQLSLPERSELFQKVFDVQFPLTLTEQILSA